MSVEKTKSKLLLTERALRDIAEVERYSISEWGKKTAAKLSVAARKGAIFAVWAKVAAGIGWRFGAEV